MVGLVVLAGGQSRRMGQDKARMAGGVRRILDEAKAAGLSPRIVLAGPHPRGQELTREGWTAAADLVIDDPVDATCLHDVLVHVFNGTLPSVVLTPTRMPAPGWMAQSRSGLAAASGTSQMPALRSNVPSS